MSSSCISGAASRRVILKGILAGVAVGSANLQTPASAHTDEELVEYHIEQLRSIFARMHPNVSVHHPHYLQSRRDGSYRLSIQGDVEFQKFEGDGVYLVSIDGNPWEYLVREEPMVTLSGRHLGWSHYWGRSRAEDGGWDHVEVLVRNFIRKLGDVSI